MEVLAAVFFGSLVVVRVEVLAFGPRRGPCCGHCVAVLVVFHRSGLSCGPESDLLLVVLVVLVEVLASSTSLWSLVVVVLGSCRSWVLLWSFVVTLDGVLVCGSCCGPLLWLLVVISCYGP